MSLEAFAVSTASSRSARWRQDATAALLLAARFRAPRPIILGILVATLFNHALAAAFGAWLTQLVRSAVATLGLGGSFIAVALWMLVPDQADEVVEGTERSRFGVFGVTVVAFFLAEMGDKTQIATVMLAARYNALVVVTGGTTLGMMIANVPAVLLATRRLSSCRSPGCVASRPRCS